MLAFNFYKTRSFYLKNSNKIRNNFPKEFIPNKILTKNNIIMNHHTLLQKKEFIPKNIFFMKNNIFVNQYNLKQNFASSYLQIFKSTCFNQIFTRHYCSGKEFKKIIDKENKKKFFESFNYDELLDKINNLKKEINENIFMKDVKDMLEEMEKRKYDLTKFRILIIIFIFLILIVFYDLIINWAGKQTTNITTKSLNDPIFQKEVVIFCKEHIHQLVNSKEIQDDIANLLKNAVIEISKNEELQKSLSDLFVNIFLMETIANSGGQLSQKVLEKIINSPEYEPLRIMIYEYISKETEKLSGDKKIHDDLSKLLKGSLKSMFLWKK
jgi:hypothetical protein